ncbi:MAG TPA: bifunctional folylpolyglutamate synthase/dihydrofolate synthase [Dehalococcoidia bacterium]|nr:bifunctional folylpolyglutamate synthase/dihydrofolate synthase [Dehalococcoidia bacterium]
MDYRAAVDFILSLTDYERTPPAYTAENYDLRRMEELLAPLGDVHKGIKAVHIAGTKGKGSTAAMVASVLSTAGYRTGLYTSPHLHTIRERLQIDNHPIPESEFARLVQALQPQVEKVNREAHYGLLTTYEVLTALAFIYFVQEGVDYQVLEVGLGGRLDATNIIEAPQVCIITSISLDHTDVLGHTLSAIAAEKAGIIKPGSTVVSAPQVPEAARVIEEACRRHEATLIKVGNDITWHRDLADRHGQSLTVRGRRGHYRISTPLIGDHQAENAATAVAALEVLAGYGASLSAKDIAQGLKGTRWPGRLQLLGQRPWLVVDGAHNADSARRLGIALREYFPHRRLILVMGTSFDKDIPGMVRELAQLDPLVIATRSHHPRSASPSVIQGEWAKQNVPAAITQSVSEGLARAKALAQGDDLICVTGSLFVVAEAIEYEGAARWESNRVPG